MRRHALETRENYVNSVPKRRVVKDTFYFLSGPWSYQHAGVSSNLRRLQQEPWPLSAIKQFGSIYE
jgi:hypothetical protein